MGTANQKALLPIIYIGQEATGAFDRKIVSALSCCEVEAVADDDPRATRSFSGTQFRPADCTSVLSSRCFFPCVLSEDRKEAFCGDCASEGKEPASLLLFWGVYSNATSEV